VYGLLAVEIGATFFPQSSKELQLVNSFGVYLAAFIMRPIGAILFGEIGDRIVGRKHALVFSILLITIPSILMGVLPGYDTWGYISPVLLVLLRMMQGLSVGGQLAGSYVLSIEQSSAKSRGFRGSVCDASSVRILFLLVFISHTLSVRLFVVFVFAKRKSLTHTNTLHILFNRLVDSCWHRW
jgi:MHS family proline/betaine transporter-like MFS transporter